MWISKVVTRLALALSTASLLFLHGCASVDIWPRPLATPRPQQSWPAPDDPGELDLETVRESLLILHNRARIEEKRLKVQTSLKLQVAAQRHAEEMAERRKMTHTGSDGSTSAERIRAQGYRYKRCGENIAYGHYSPEHVMRGWLNSPPHRKNILGAFTQIGIGYAKAKDGTPYWCVTFGLPAQGR